MLFHFWLLSVFNYWITTLGFLRPGVALSVSFSAQGISWSHDTTLAGASRYNRPLRNSSLSLLSLLSPFLPSDDHSRVRLQLLDGDPHSDYINANYIDVRLLDKPLWQTQPVTSLLMNLVPLTQGQAVDLMWMTAEHCTNIVLWQGEGSQSPVYFVWPIWADGDFLCLTDPPA